MCQTLMWGGGGGGLFQTKNCLKSGRLDVLNGCIAIMTDKGHFLEDLLQGTGKSIVRPHYLSSGKQFTGAERDIGRDIARHHIVIENENARAKCNQILKDKIPVTCHFSDMSYT